MKDFLVRAGALVQAIGLELAVSYAGLALYGLAAVKQLIMSQYDRVLDVSPSNVTIQLETHDDHAHICFKIHELRWTDLPTDACARRAAVAAEWERYFNDEFNPVLEQVSAAGGLKPDLIWNQYGSRVLYVMEYVRGIMPQGPMLKQIEDDYLLLASLPPETFNRKRGNPFSHTPSYIDNPYKPGSPLMIRSGCCMWYRREAGEKCYSCPILKGPERERMKAEIEAKVAQEA
ncbi:(2Fe-2S)-binding protein [Cohnella sp. GCM10027633]|uniref:(2Fe-2S)-binding protein n=1 Tax=unclassified Cohnella TaxID=2636738 RepID=UPI00362652E0